MSELYIFSLGKNADPDKSGLSGWDSEKTVETAGEDRDDARRRAVACNIGWQVLNVWA